MRTRVRAAYCDTEIMAPTGELAPQRARLHIRACRQRCDRQAETIAEQQDDLAWFGRRKRVPRHRHGCRPQLAVIGVQRIRAAY